MGRTRPTGRGLALLAAAFTAWLPVAHAQDWYVDVNFAGCATGDGSPGNPFCSITEAVDAAADGDVIHIAPGNYLENLLLNKDLTLLQDPPGAGTVTIDGQRLASTVEVGMQSVVSLEGLTITKGNTLRGGGIYLRGQSSLTLTDSTITGNTGVLLGGGICAEETSVLTIVDCTIAANFGESGGGVFVRDSSVLVVDSVMEANVAEEGGGIWVGTGAVHIQGTTLRNNELAADRMHLEGGGMKVFGGTVTLVNSTVADNIAENGDYGGSGGGIWNEGNLTITNCTITGNFVGGGEPAFGGGIANSGTLMMFNTTISSNTSFYPSGGGIHNDGTLEATNCTIASNRGNRGGGLFNGNVATLSHCTVASNRAAYAGSGGGGVYASGPSTTYLDHTIVAQNVSQSQPPPVPDDCFGTFMSEGYNLIQHPTGFALVGDLTGNLIGVDPLLLALSSNGGPTLTSGVEPGSPVIDKGSPDPARCPATDQRGVPRRNCDIGAFERTLALDIDPDVALANDPMTLATGPGLPNGFHALFLVDVNGVRFVLLLLVAQLDAAGESVIATTVPPALAGSEIGLQSFGFDAGGRLVATNPEFLQVTG